MQFTQMVEERHSLFPRLSYVALHVQFHNCADENEGKVQITLLVPRPSISDSVNDQNIRISRIINARTTTTTTAASRTTTSSTTTTGPPRWTRRDAIPVVAEAGCAESSVHPVTASIQHTLVAISGASTVERVNLP